MTPTWPARLGTLALLALLAPLTLTACDDDVERRGGPSVDAPVGPPGVDVTENGSISLAETALEATFINGKMKVMLPVQLDAARVLSGTADVELFSLLDGAVIARDSETFEGRGLVRVDLELPLAPGGDDPASLANYAINWKANSDAGLITGRRSVFSAWTQKTAVLVLGPDHFEVDQPGIVRIVARDPVTGAARVDVPAQIRLMRDGKPDAELARGVTDAYGVILAHVAPNADLLGPGNLRVDVESPVFAPRIDAAVAVERTSRVMLTTDKPLYQPGQKIHLRALALRKPALTPEANRPLVFEIFDAKDNKIEHQEMTTDAFGVTHFTLGLAREVNLGTWRITATLDDVVTEKTVTVDRYSLPKFDLKIALDQPVYLAGDRVRGTVTARYFFGRAVAGGQVVLNASTIDAGENVFAELQGQTNEEGVYAFELNLPDYLVGLPIAQGGGLIGISAQVTDTAGQARTVSQSVRVAKGPLEIQAVPESGALVPGLENRVLIRATDALGEPVAATHTVSLNGASEGDFEGDDTGLAVAVIDVPGDVDGPGAAGGAPVGNATLSVSSRDADGHDVENVFTLSTDINAAQGSVLLRTDRALYRVGDTATVSVTVSGAPDRVYLDVIRAGQTVLTQVLTPDADGNAKYELDLSGDHTGALQFDAFYLAQGSSFRRDSKLVYVEAADGLTIDVQSDREVYAPGEQARLTVQVTDSEGNGKAAALGLQGVDEAVFSLIEQRPGLEKIFFRVEGELSEPRYQLGVPGLSDIAANPEASDDARTQGEAEMLFAATDGAAPGIAADTWTGTEARTTTFVQPAIQRLADEAGLQLEGPLSMSDSFSEPDLLTALVSSLAPVVDPFGEIVRLEAQNGYQLRVLSAGPDEAFETLDDVAAFHDFPNYAPQRGDDFAEGDFADADGANEGAGAGNPEQPAPPPGAEPEEGSAAPRVRRNFPETLFVTPDLITDGDGQAELTVDLADSITTWRISALANSADGLLGSTDRGLRVFQDFFVDLEVPATVTRGDEIGITLALYNYLPEAQTVTLDVAAADWFTLLGDAQIQVALEPNEVKGLRIPMRVERVGTHPLQVTARGTTLSDAVERQMRVEPDGQKVEQIASGRLSAPVQYTTQIPQGSVADSGSLLVRIYPGLMSQVVTGLDGILTMPSGCFEQTSSSTWPNVLVEKYMQDTGTVNPELEARAMEYINTGYQRLLTFEVPGGGFEWFGEVPAHVVLTAYGLLEFTDMATVRTVDENMIARTRDWLLSQQADDGHWEAGEGGYDETGQLRDTTTITAYVAFALAAAGEDSPALTQAAAFLAQRQNMMGEYSLALYGNFLASWRPDDANTRLVIGALAERVQASLDHWETDEQTTTYGNGEPAWIETTALATHALMLAGAHRDTINEALGWLVTKRSPGGAWGSTAGTVWTIKCLLRGLSGGQDEAANGTIRVLFDGVERSSFALTPENSDVMRQADLSELVMAGGGQSVEIIVEGEGNLAYDIVERWHMPWDGVEPSSGPLSISVDYDRTTLAVDDMVTASVTISNVDQAFADMVMVDLGIPPGFSLVRDDLEALKLAGLFDRYDATERQLLLYFTAVPPGEPIVFEYRLVATEPVRAQAPRNRIYSYYNPDVSSEAPPVEFEVQ